MNVLPTDSRPRLRGEKAPLSRGAVIQAALTCLKRGSSALTMRAVAALLETGPGSLYVYVRDQRELHRLVLDSIASEVARQAPGADPTSRLVNLLMRYAGQLLSYPGAAGLALDHPPTGPSFLDLMEAALELLVASGFSINRASCAVDGLFLLVTGAMAEQDARRLDEPARSVGDLYAAAIDQEGPSRHPLLTAARPDAFELGGGQRLEWMLRAFINGLATAPEPPQSGSNPGSGKDSP